MDTKFIFALLDEKTYPVSPFHPDQDYPEFNHCLTDFDKNNEVYRRVRDLFLSAGYDPAHVGTTTWNPFRGMVGEGQTVIIKPNLVYEETGKRTGSACLLTHASVIRPVVDYLLLLMRTDKIGFRIQIADVPIQGADFRQILHQSGLRSLQSFYRESLGFDLEILDLRNKIVTTDKTGFYIQLPATGDPLGYSKIHLEESFLNEIEKDYKKFGAPGYGKDETFSQIKETGHHFYHIANTILSADLFINIPKLKTHKKAGITIAMKNLVGINGEKAWIPHYRRGSTRSGGDEFDDRQALLKTITTRANVLLQGRSKVLWRLAKWINTVFIKQFFRKDLKKTKNLTEIEKKTLFLLNGNWYGNDTLWRPILDLNRLLFSYGKDGTKTEVQARKYICITDGIIAGEGDGPLDPDPKPVGIVALSENPVINDICFSKIMGFDWRKIPQLCRAVELKEHFQFNGNPNDLKIYQSAEGQKIKALEFDSLPEYAFIPSPGWIGHIEAESSPDM